MKDRGRVCHYDPVASSVRQLDVQQDISAWNVLEDLQSISWVLKDATWCCLILPLALPFGVAAVLLQALLLYSNLSSTSSTVHNFATALWLLGNFIWMIGEIGFDESQTNVNFGDAPFFAYRLEIYHSTVDAARIFFATGIAVLVCFYATIIWRESIVAVARYLRDDAYIDHFEDLHVIFWLLKDLLWSVNDSTAGVFAVMCSSMAAAISCRVIYVKVGTNDRHGALSAIVLLLWICANAIWMTGEIFFEDQARPFSLVLFAICASILLSLIYPHVSTCSLRGENSGPVEISLAHEEGDGLSI